MQRYEEQFVSGFCKTQNQTRMVICEFRVEEDGHSELEETDCAYGKCPHSADCVLMQNALALRF